MTDRKAPRLGWYGDDFTGATDTLATLAQAGLRTLLFLGVPTPAQLHRAGALDAVGIAGASRAMAPDAMARELAPVGRFFASLGVSVLHYKCCSTFDSAPEVGSIGAAVAALRPHVANRFLPVIGGQPNLGRYCLFGNLFAAAGAGGDIHRIDRHPTMSRHPVTPMTEADLRRHLAAQGLGGIGTVPYPAYGLPPRELDARVALAAEGSGVVLFDVAREQDLAAIGRLIWRHAADAPLLAVGASSVARALAASWPDPAGPRQPEAEAPLGAPDGPVFLFVGSLSPVTRRQVETAGAYRRIPIEAGHLVGAAEDRARVLAEVLGSLEAGHHTMVVTDEPGAGGSPPPMDVARASAAFVAAVIERRPLGRLGIAGGDTSSLAAQALPLWGLSCLTTLGPGVTVCRGHSDRPEVDGMEIMLKGGQMGAPDLFDRFAAGRRP